MATDPNDPTTTDAEHQPAGVDRVQEPSKNPDGSPAQREGFETIEDPDADAQAATESRSAPADRQADVEETTTRRRKST